MEEEGREIWGEIERDGVGRRNEGNGMVRERQGQGY